MRPMLTYSVHPRYALGPAVAILRRNGYAAEFVASILRSDASHLEVMLALAEADGRPVRCDAVRELSRRLPAGPSEV